MKRKMFEYIIPKNMKNPGIDMYNDKKIIIQDEKYNPLYLKIIDNNISAIQKEILDEVKNHEYRLWTFFTIKAENYPYILIAHRDLENNKKEISVLLSKLTTERPINWLD